MRSPSESQDKPGEQARVGRFGACRSLNLVLSEDGLDVVPQSLVDDGLVLTRRCRALMPDHTPINPVRQEAVEGPDVKGWCRLDFHF